MSSLVWLAGIWGFVAGSALLLGAVTAYFTHVPDRVIASLMSLGTGAMVSALAFELMGKAYQAGGIDASAMGFITGMTVYTVANFYLSYRGARHRKRAFGRCPEKRRKGGAGLPSPWARSWTASPSPWPSG